MYQKRSRLGLIPARGGSKGLPRKNLRLLGGKPLIAEALMQRNGRLALGMDK